MFWTFDYFVGLQLCGTVATLQSSVICDTIFNQPFLTDNYIILTMLPLFTSLKATSINVIVYLYRYKAAGILWQIEKCHYILGH